MAIENTQQEQLDQNVVRLAKAIRQVESKGNYEAKGGSGEFGAYQYTPGTWNADVVKFTGKAIPLEQADKLLQNEVAYKKLKALKDQGYNIGQVASIWNSGQPEWKGKKGTNEYGVKYDVPAYVDKVAKEYQTLKAQNAPEMAKTAVSSVFTPTVNQQADIATKEQYGATFAPNTQDPSAIGESAKVIGNLPSSTWNFVKGALDLINPVSTYKRIKESVGAFQELSELKGGAGKATLAAVQEYPESVIKSFVPQSGQNIASAAGAFITGDQAKEYEKLKSAQRAIVSDPVGQIAPYIFYAKGAATLKGKGAAFDTTMTKVTEPVIKSIKAVGETIKNTVSGGTKFGTSQAFGIPKDIVSDIIKNQEKYSPEVLKSVSRESLGAEVEAGLTKRANQLNITQENIGKQLQATIDKRQSSLQSTGKAYNPIRQSNINIKVNKSWLKDNIKETTGLKLKNGKWQANPNSTIRNSSDIRAIQQMYDLYQPSFNKGQINANEFLNFRSDLADMAHYGKELTKSKPVENVGKNIRNKFNTEYREQVPNLEKTDASFSKQINELKELRSGLFDRQGNLTDTGINKVLKITKEKPNLVKQLEKIDPKILDKVRILQKEKLLKKGLVDSDGNITDVGMRKIVNATRQGNELLLKQLETIVPDITSRIKIYRAAQAIEEASGFKVGTYGRGAILGGTFVFGGAIQGVIMAILLNPKSGVAILRTFGLLKNSQVTKQVVSILKNTSTKVNQLPAGNAELPAIGGQANKAMTNFGRKL